ncbi:MAG TPA: GGDEF domain-containing protein, partial [Verrucomicrobiae bacterium]|nr:GGDEF domain-containing protein [Verrucomicrobiae bacterium]
FRLAEARGFGEAGAELGEAFFERYLNDETNFSYASKYIDNLSLVAGRLHGSLDLREALVLFIKSKQEFLGCVALFNNQGANLPSSINYNRFTFLLDQASRAFENATRYANLKNLIYIDELTGLFNYRYLDIALEREMKRVERYGATVSVVFLDLDLFKNVNDTHGHLVGSQVLREVGALLKKSVRDVDVVVRYGGDEYTIILTDIGSKEVAVVAERIRATLENHRFLPGDLDIRITASLGYACFPEDGVTKQELLDMADQAMYRGKASGKNRVFRATEAMGTTTEAE